MTLLRAFTDGPGAGSLLSLKGFNVEKIDPPVGRLSLPRAWRLSVVTGTFGGIERFLLVLPWGSFYIDR